MSLRSSFVRLGVGVVFFGLLFIAVWPPVAVAEEAVERGYLLNEDILLKEDIRAIPEAEFDRGERHVFFAKLNSDDEPDLIIFDLEGDPIIETYVFVDNADPQPDTYEFRSRVTDIDPAKTYLLAIADVWTNGDSEGFPDVVIVGPNGTNGTQIQTLKNLGGNDAGVLADADTTNVNDWATRSIAIDYFNEDSDAANKKLDIALAGRSPQVGGSKGIRMLPGLDNGVNTFDLNSMKPTETPHEPGDIYPADTDGDKGVDLIASMLGKPGLILLRNKKGASYGEFTVVP